MVTQYVDLIDRIYELAIGSSRCRRCCEIVDIIRKDRIEVAHHRIGRLRKTTGFRLWASGQGVDRYMITDAIQCCPDVALDTFNKIRLKYKASAELIEDEEVIDFCNAITGWPNTQEART